MADNRQKRYFGGLNRNYFPGQSGNRSNPYATGINVGAAVGQGVRTAQASMPKQSNRLSPEELQKMRADQIVASNLDGSPQIQWSNYSNLPSNIRDIIDPIVDSSGAEAGYLKHIQQNMGQTDFIGRSQTAGAISRAQDVITGVIPKQLAQLDAMYEGFDQDADSFLISDTMSPEDKAFISDLNHGKITPEIDENGIMRFNGRTIDELPEYYNKDIKTGSTLTKNLISAYDAGVKLSDEQMALQRVNIQNMLNEGGVNSIMSVAFDDVMGFGTSLLDKNAYSNELAAIRGNDPEAKMLAKKTLSDAITEAYLGKLKEQSDAGYTFKNKPKPGGPKSDMSGNDTDIVSWYGQHEWGYNAITFNADGTISDLDLGENPTASDLGIKLANMGFILGESGGRQQLYSVDGGEPVDGAAVIEAIDVEGFSELTPDQKEKVLKKYKVKKAGLSKPTYNIRPKKGGTAADRKGFALDIDVKDPQSVQNAINRLNNLDL